MEQKTYRDLDFQVYEEAGHDTSWWPEERPKYEAFLASHARQPHPARVSDAVVARDAGVLQKWAARDNDRTMLYAAELRITVP